jgi:hypothetical protein
VCSLLLFLSFFLHYAAFLWYYPIMMIPGSKAPTTDRACTMRGLSLGPAKT